MMKDCPASAFDVTDLGLGPFGFTFPVVSREPIDVDAIDEDPAPQLPPLRLLKRRLSLHQEPGHFSSKLYMDGGPPQKRRLQPDLEHNLCCDGVESQRVNCLNFETASQLIPYDRGRVYAA